MAQSPAHLASREEYIIGLAPNFTQALEDDSIQGIVLNIDSPGGQMNGTNELANMIFAARGTKPITAYVGGLGASGAYWIASAADEIAVDATFCDGVDSEPVMAVRDYLRDKMKEDR